MGIVSLYLTGYKTLRYWYEIFDIFHRIAKACHVMATIYFHLFGILQLYGGVGHVCHDLVRSE